MLCLGSRFSPHPEMLNAYDAAGTPPALIITVPLPKLPPPACIIRPPNSCVQEISPPLPAPPAVALLGRTVGPDRRPSGNPGEPGATPAVNLSVEKRPEAGQEPNLLLLGSGTTVEEALNQHIVNPSGDVHQQITLPIMRWPQTTDDSLTR